MEHNKDNSQKRKKQFFIMLDLSDPEPVKDIKPETGFTNLLNKMLKEYFSDINTSGGAK